MESQQPSTAQRELEEPMQTSDLRNRTSARSGFGMISVHQPGVPESNADRDQLERESFISEVPDWIGVEELPWRERVEIQLYRLVSLVPVTVTLCLYIYLYIYYVIFYLSPVISQDYSRISFDAAWTDDSQLSEDQSKKAIFYAVLFAFTSTMLIVSIVRTISTNPGNIPEHKEWDMSTDTSGGEETISMMTQNKTPQQPLSQDDQGGSEQFTNQLIEKQTREPKEVVHEDLKYLNTTAGPLYAAPQRSQQQQAGTSDKSPKKQASVICVAPSVERKRYGGVRICQWCYKAKPDRCHHCSQCNRCVLKMDHHCPWVANCIGFYNYKFFLNMLFHCSLTCLLLVITSQPIISRTMSHPESFDYKVSYFVMTAYILACVLAFIITAFLTFHMYLISCGFTTIEFCEKRGEEESGFHTKQPFNRGFCQNLSGILGPNPITWFIPFFPDYEGDGIVFKLNKEFERAH